MILARDLMTPNPICILAEKSVFEVVSFFLQNHVVSVPVIDVAGRVLGQISDINLMRAFVQTKLVESDQHKIIEYKNLFFEPRFVNVSAKLADVVSAMVNCPLNRVLVHNGSNQLVGIISPKDILRSITGHKSGNLISKLRELEASAQNLGQALQKTEIGLQSYKHMFEDSLFMMHSLDSKGHITMANTSLHEFLEYGQDELIGKTVYDIHPQSLHETIRSGLENSSTKGQHDLTLSSFVTKSGQIRRVELISSFLKDDSGNVNGTIVLSRLVDGDTLLRTLHGALN